METSLHSLYPLIRDAIDKLLEEVHVSQDLTQIDFLGALGLADGGDEGVSEFTSRRVSKQSLYDEVSAALYGISDAYSGEQLRFEANANLFDDPVYRCAYIFLYFVSHSYMVRLFLLEAYNSSEECRVTLEKVLDSGVMKTCAVGGGPGTDVVGTLLFLQELAVLKKMKSRSPSTQAYRFEEYEQRSLQQSSFRNRIRSVSYPNFRLRPTADFENGTARGRRRIPFGLYDGNHDLRDQPRDWEARRNFEYGTERQRRPLCDRSDLQNRIRLPEGEMQRIYDGYRHPGVGKPLDFCRVFADDYYARRRSENHLSSMRVPEHLQLPPFHHNNSSDSYKPDTVKPVSLSSIILDNCESWRETADSTFSTLRPLCTHFGCTLEKVKYGTVDIMSKEFSDNECSALEYADVVTMVKVVSAVASGDKEEIALEAVWSLFKKLKPGCLVLYVDNSGGGSTELICGAAESVGMRQLFRKTSVECTVPRCEDKKVLDFYIKKFKYEPQRRAKVSAIMWKK